MTQAYEEFAAYYDRLMADTQAVLDSLIPQEVPVQTHAGAWYTMRIQPYRTLDNVIEGVVLTFVDITEVKKTQEALAQAQKQGRLAVVAADAADAMIVQELATGRILAWNPGAQRLYGWSEAEALKLTMRDLIPAELRPAALAQVQQLSREEILAPYPTQRLSQAGTLIEVSIIATALVNENDQIYAIATTERRRDGGPLSSGGPLSDGGSLSDGGPSSGPGPAADSAPAPA